MGPADHRRVVEGEIVRTEGDRLIVRLEDGSMGTLSLPEDSSQHSPLTVGFRGRFQVEPCDANAQPVLVLLSGELTSVPADPYDQDVHRLNSVLTNHRLATNGWNAPGDPVGEKQIEAWVSRVGDALSRIRKNRTKRLDEQF